MEEKLLPIHPIEILQQDFLVPLYISAYQLAKETYINQTLISEILKGKRSVTIDTALRLAKFFGTSPEFWINIQTQYDMEIKSDEISDDLQKINTISHKSA